MCRILQFYYNKGKQSTKARKQIMRSESRKMVLLLASYQLQREQCATCNGRAITNKADEIIERAEQDQQVSIHNNAKELNIYH